MVEQIGQDVNLVYDMLVTRVCVCCQPPQPFAELLGEPGKPVRPVWELLKWTVGRSSHTMAAVGNIPQINK